MDATVTFDSKPARAYLAELAAKVDADENINFVDILHKLNICACYAGRYKKQNRPGKNRFLKHLNFLS